MLMGCKYYDVMRMWFIANGGDIMDDLTQLCDRWYEITRTGWDGGTQFDHATKSMGSEGVKIGDNANMVAKPSTNTIAGRDDYANVPLFHCIDCNWFLDSDGKPHITAIDGIAGNFERTNPAKLVGVIQMAGWMWYEDSDDTFTWHYTDEQNKQNYEPLPEAINLDGSVRTWVVHAKYLTGDDIGCYSGVAPLDRTISHNSSITLFHENYGMQYGGKTSADDAFIKLMFYLKYAYFTSDGIIQGCCTLNHQYTVAVTESNVERVILNSAQAANFPVGATVIVGVSNASSIDRNELTMRSLVDRKRIISKTNVGSNVALNLDNGGVKFSTEVGKTYVSSMPWYTGTCDNVLGVDGSPTNYTDGKEPALLQGIEYMNGGYELISDCMWQYSTENGHNVLGMLVCRDASKYATAPTSDYNPTICTIQCPQTDSWEYISEMLYDPKYPEMRCPALTGCTDAQRTKDGMYIYGTKSSGNYELLSLGGLNNGVGIGGLSCAPSGDVLTNSRWAILTRISATGNRGAWNN